MVQVQPGGRAGWANRLTLTTKARQGPLLPPDINTLPSTDPPYKAQRIRPDSNQSPKFSPNLLLVSRLAVSSPWNLGFRVI